MQTVLITLGLLILIAVMIAVVRIAKSTRADQARKHKAGFIIMSSLFLGAGSMIDQPPPRAEDARNNTLDKKSQSAGSKDETL